MKDYYRVRALIDLDAVYENLKTEKESLPQGTLLMAVIKADGYGHGAVPIARFVDGLVDKYAVATIEEAMELRNAGIDKEILILGAVNPHYYELLVTNDISQTVFTYDSAKKLNEVALEHGKKAKIHIKLDTGMGRIGFRCDKEGLEEIVKINGLSNIEIDGTFTHLARADETDKDFSRKQFGLYMTMVDEMKKAGVEPGIRHIANSAGIIDLPEFALDMVRSGISTYGLYPSEQVDHENIKLKPAMSIKTCITYIKEVDEGTGISYNSTFVTKRKTRVATVPVGYADGYSRALSSKGHVLVEGKKAPIIGRICMDQFMIDVTDIENVTTDSVVTLLGVDGNESISAEEISALAGSFNYEFVCVVGKRIPRVYYSKGQKVGTYDFYDCAHYGLDLNF